MNDELLVLENFLPYRLSVLSNRLSTAIAESYSRTLRPVDPGMARHGRAGAGAGAVRGRGRRAHRDGQGRRQPRGQPPAADRPNPPRDGAGDRRRSVLELTAEGRHIYQRHRPRPAAFEAELLGRLNPGERRQLEALLRKLEALRAAAPSAAHRLTGGRLALCRCVAQGEGCRTDRVRPASLLNRYVGQRA
jgi:hypothetical protein